MNSTPRIAQQPGTRAKAVPGFVLYALPAAGAALALCISLALRALS